MVESINKSGKQELLSLMITNSTCAKEILELFLSYNYYPELKNKENIMFYYNLFHNVTDS